jgi:hypothetical protein
MASNSQEIIKDIRGQFEHMLEAGPSSPVISTLVARVDPRPRSGLYALCLGRGW